MRIISRYVLKHFLSIFALAMVGFAGIFMVVDFFERLDHMLSNHLTHREIYTYFLYKIPPILTQGIPQSPILPMAANLAAIIALGMLKRNRELIAMETAGIHPTRYVAPIVVAALGISVLQFFMSEFVARPLNHKVDEIWDVKVEHSKPALSMNLENIWFRDENTIYQVRLYDRAKNVMNAVSIFFLDQRFQTAKRIDARSITWKNPGWLAEDGLIVAYHDGNTEQQRFERKTLDLNARPADFEKGETLPRELSWTELYRYVQKIESEGFSATPYRADLHTRLASPVATLILVLLGVIVALKLGIHEGIVAGVGLALIIAFFFIAISYVGISLASAGSLPPLLGVCAGNIIFAALFFYFWIKDILSH